jgi:hypothetical protein
MVLACMNVPAGIQTSSLEKNNILLGSQKFTIVMNHERNITTCSCRLNQSTAEHLRQVPLLKVLTTFSLVQRSPADCGASLFVISEPPEGGGSNS